MNVNMVLSRLDFKTDNPSKKNEYEAIYVKKQVTFKIFHRDIYIRLDQHYFN